MNLALFDCRERISTDGTESRHAPAFQDRIVPQETRLAGWAALVHGLGIAAPVRAASAVASGFIKGSRRDAAGWNVFDKRYWPGRHVTDHIRFALRHEWFNPLVLKRVFEAADQETISAFVRDAPSGAVNRRAWFFHKSMTGRQGCRNRRSNQRTPGLPGRELSIACR